MGYRVGYQCVDTQLMADDLVLSKQSPVITETGQIVRPVRVSDGWYLNNAKIQLSYPPCDPVVQMQLGAKIGAAFLALIVFAYCLRLMAKFISSVFKVQGSEE